MDALVLREALTSGDGDNVVAAPGVWYHRSTREVAPGDRFDFCRALSTGSHVERPLRARGDFFGDFRYTTTSDGVAFGEINIDPCVSRFGPGGEDGMVDIGMIYSGTMQIRHGRDQTLALDAAAGPVVFDAARPMTTRTSRSDVAYLRLSRAAVVAAVGGDVVPRGVAVRLLESGALKAQLAACMGYLQRGAVQSAATVAAELHTAQALALVTLAKVRGAGHHWTDELCDALYLAACHQLVQGVANPRLTVDAVAAVLGCSRAQLYRLFAARNQSVAGYLHELRMQRAAAALRKRPQLAISAITLLCGYGEPAAFNKAFRRRFGMTPGDWRTRAALDARA